MKVRFFRPGLSKNIVYNNFTNKLLSKLLRDLSIGVQLKGMWSLILRSLKHSKVVDRSNFHRKTGKYFFCDFKSSKI